VAARSPWQNGQVERLIGSIRKECLDQVIVFGEAHLRRVLKRYALHKNAAESRQVHRVGSITALPVLGGLHHHYVKFSVATPHAPPKLALRRSFPV
jgi:hypothetical protein